MESKKTDTADPPEDPKVVSRKRPAEEPHKHGGKRASGSSEPEPARVRPRSAPPQDDLKREALARIFLDAPAETDVIRRLVEQLSDGCDSESGDEEDDPLLDSVPSHLDPERLGFLVCAQETLRYLYRRGVPHDHPIFTNLRTRFIRGLNQMGLD